MTTRLAILGSGAIGGALGGLLTAAGHDVTLIDAWAPHVEAMRTKGLHLTIGPLEAPEADRVIPVRALDVNEVCTVRDPFDIVFVACKSYDTRWLVQLIEPHLAADGVVVSVQNSMNEEWIAPIVGDDRVMACVLTAGGELLEPGHVWRNRKLDYHYYTLGEVDGSTTPRLERIAAILADAGKVTTSTTIRGSRWSKLVTNTASAAMSGLVDTHKREWELVSDPAWRSASARLYQESVGVTKARGETIEPLFGMTADELLHEPGDVVGRLMAAKAGGASEGATTMIQQDLMRGRPTEVTGYFNGLMAAKAREIGIPTPMNDAMVAIYERLERGDLAPHMDNLVLLDELAGAAVAGARA